MQNHEFHPDRIADGSGRYVEIITAYDGTKIHIGHGTVLIQRPGHTVHALNEDGGRYQELELRPEQ